ncbi:DUF4882 domain-containing protein [Acinetobacter sp. C26M]|uniref:DUF4882 family protein n=1 Tax=unclassified Acinetobacter TaxID=196816 RepID=UPI002036F1DE|nr:MULTISPECIES: DUF4882 family protein [unclassified Acinetobacter]USA45200.1 DUF4882 domain-containing protein [Acinetobacter sp. C26M]USA48702.1 DUF4882 domain-containing protein [Acinetobacter sp. C26G]
MKKLILGALFSIPTLTSAFPLCAYNLDATPSEISNYILGGRVPEKFPILDGQSYGYKVLARNNTSNDSKLYVAGSSKFINDIVAWNNADNSKEADLQGDVVLQDSGVYAFEYKINSFPYSTLSSNSKLSLGSMIVGTSNNRKSVHIITTLSNASPSTGFQFKIEIIDKEASTYYPFVYNFPYELTNFRYGLYFNQDTKQIGLIFNGVNKGYLRTLTSKIDSLGIILQGESNGGNSIDGTIGKTISGGLVTDKTQLKYFYPVTTKDICGNRLR